MRRHSFLESFFLKKTENIKLGLDRIAEAYALLGKPSSRAKNVLVAGTNGKGSTASFLTMLLQKEGKKTGLFTSPHLIEAEERIWVDGPAEEEWLHILYQEASAVLGKKRTQELSFFEWITLLAALYFEKKKTTFNVFEVGLGGRLDATNILPRCLSVITTIGLDHQLQLGPTLEAIAAEKAGILRAGVPLVLGESIPPEAKSIILEKARLVGTGPVVIEKKTTTTKHAGVLQNFSLAEAAYFQLLAKEADSTHSREGLEGIPCPPGLIGRYHQAKIKTQKREMEAWIDVAHNEEGIENLLLFCSQQGLQGAQALVCSLRDKDQMGIAARLSRFFESVSFFKLADDSPAFLKERSYYSREFQAQYKTFDSFFDALRFLEESAVVKQVVITGTVIGVGQILAKGGVNLRDRAYFFSQSVVDPLFLDFSAFC